VPHHHLAAGQSDEALSGTVQSTLKARCSAKTWLSFIKPRAQEKPGDPKLMWLPKWCIISICPTYSELQLCLLIKVTSKEPQGLRTSELEVW
jgi:hypothetical protein